MQDIHNKKCEICRSRIMPQKSMKSGDDVEETGWNVEASIRLRIHKMYSQNFSAGWVFNQNIYPTGKEGSLTKTWYFFFSPPLFWQLANLDEPGFVPIKGD